MTPAQHILQIEAEIAALKARLVKQSRTMEREAPAREWEILEYKEEDGTGLINASLLSTSHIPQYEIWTVKRLTDNTIWTVGDKFLFDGRTLLIKSFQILDNKHDLAAMCGVVYGYNILNIDPCAPLFTTADGVKLYDNNQNVYSLSIRGANYTGNIIEVQAGYIIDWKRAYSTRLAAEKAYNAWLAEQPVLSLNDISRFIDIGPYCELEALVKDKIAKR